MIDLKEHNLSPPNIFSAEITAAINVLQQHGYTVVPIARMRTIKVGGKTQKPPKDASEEDQAKHWMGVMKNIAEATGREMLKQRIFDMARTAIANEEDFEMVMFSLLTVLRTSVGAPLIKEPQKFGSLHEAKVADQLSGAKVFDASEK